MPCRTVTFSSIFIGTVISSYSANNNAAVIHPTGFIWLPDMPCWTVTSYFGAIVRGGQFDRRVVGLFHIGQSLSLAFSWVPCWTVTSYFGAIVRGEQFDRRVVGLFHIGQSLSLAFSLGQSLHLAPQTKTRL